MLRAASRITSGKFHSLSMRVGYATVGAMIIIPKTVSYCDQTQLQPKKVNIPVIPKPVIKIAEKSWLKKAEDFYASIIKWLRNLYRMAWAHMLLMLRLLYVFLAPLHMQRGHPILLLRRGYGII